MLDGIYGTDTALQDTRIGLVLQVLRAFIARFGDLPVRIHRAPGRINLRGMHVDTHGGWLNLATHQREVVCVSAANDTGELVAANLDPKHVEARCKIDATASATLAGWGSYIHGVARRWAECDHPSPPVGLSCMLGSDLPTGASLSSSAALCIVLLDALATWNDTAPDEATRILAARDAEWYAGARTGTGDQAAIVLGRPGMLTHASLMVEDFSLDTVSRIPIPPATAILVIDSLTSRQLSGGALADYAKNRFAYSMALHILREELCAADWNAAAAAGVDRLSRATPDDLGGASAVYALLAQMPVSLSLEEIARRYSPPGLQSAYETYFGALEESARPTNFSLRGPLLFALAESERARQFPPALKQGEAAGRLLSYGHDGDRVVDTLGKPFRRAASDDALAAWRDCGKPLVQCPGDYGASTPALDFLVDAACAAGTWGASLTGAGMGGAVVALCAQSEAHEIADRIRTQMCGEAYAARSGLVLTPDDDALRDAVCINVAVTGAGELPG